LKTKFYSGMKIITLVMTLLLISSCSTSRDVPQSPTKSSGESVVIEGVTVSDAQISLHGKSSLPDTACLTTRLLADGSALPWWPDEKCIEVSQGTWKFNVSLEGKSLRTGTQYVIQAFKQGNQNPAATLAFDTSGPPQPSE
jgi:hypothetical protein